MTVRLAVAAVAALLSLAGAAQGAVSVPSTPNAAALVRCAQNRCRPAELRVQLIDGKGGQYTAVFEPLPYVENGTITIFPGETLVFHFSGTADAPGVPTFAGEAVANKITAALPADNSFQGDETTTVQHDSKTGENYYTIKAGSSWAPTETAADHLKDQPPGTLIVSYYQIDGKPDMILRFEHNFAKPLKLDAKIDRLIPAGSTGLRSTSTCSAMPVIADIESWPYPIGAITLTNFRFIDVSNGVNCEE